MVAAQSHGAVPCTASSVSRCFVLTVGSRSEQGWLQDSWVTARTHLRPTCITPTSSAALTAGKALESGDTESLSWLSVVSHHTCACARCKEGR